MNSHYEKTITSECIFNGHIITVTKDTACLENGKTAAREVVHHNGGASVIALHENGDIILIRQFRYAVGEEMWEIPAGKLEIGEDPFVAAKRELGEEAGIIADEYIDLGYIVPTCGYCTEKIYIYAAKGLHSITQNLDEDEFVTVYNISLQKAVTMCMNGEITDGKTIVAILKLQQLISENKF